jgi:DnaJ like chaperone protein
MFYKEADNSYAILGIEKTATETEIKKAYRKMVKKYHPDKLRGLGKEHLKGAEEKFRQVQVAYERIQKERGF